MGEPDLDEIRKHTLSSKIVDFWAWDARRKYERAVKFKNDFSVDDYVLRSVREKFYSTPEGKAYKRKNQNSFLD